MNPYILQGQPMQDVSGLQPVFQNFGQQQANQQAALAQQAQLAQQAGQSQGGGMNPLALAQALRKKPDDFGNSGMSNGMTNGGVTGNIYDNNGQLLTSGNLAPSAATWNQAFGGTGGMDR